MAKSIDGELYGHLTTNIWSINSMFSIITYIPRVIYDWYQSAHGIAEVWDFNCWIVFFQVGKSSRVAWAERDYKVGMKPHMQKWNQSISRSHKKKPHRKCGFSVKIPCVYLQRKDVLSIYMQFLYCAIQLLSALSIYYNLY